MLDRTKIEFSDWQKLSPEQKAADPWFKQPTSEDWDAYFKANAVSLASQLSSNVDINAMQKDYHEEAEIQGVTIDVLLNGEPS